MAEQLCRQPPDAEMKARHVAESLAVAHHQLEAAAAEIRAQRRLGVEHNARPYRFEDELAFEQPAHDLDRDA